MFFENPELEAMQALQSANDVKTSNSVFVELEHVVIKKDVVTASYSSFTDDWESEILVVYTGTIDRNDKFTLENRQTYLDGKINKTGFKSIGFDIESFEQKVSERIQKDIDTKLKIMQNTSMETKAMGFDLLDSLCMINEEFNG